MSLLRRFSELFLSKPSTSKYQIDFLDGLRGLACLFVVFSHLSNNGLVLAPSLDFSGIGKYGVYLFFVLSSYLLTRQLILKTNDDLRDKTLWETYFMRRFLRIYPLFVVVLFVNLVFHTMGVEYFIKIDLSRFFRHLYLDKGVSLLWTIPVEFKYYLVLPFVVLTAIFIAKRRPVVMAIMAAAFIALDMLIVPRLDLRSISLIPFLPIFLVGSLAALVERSTAMEDREFSLGARAAFEAVALVCLAIIVAVMPMNFSKLVHPVDFQFFHGEVLFFGVVWTVFLLGSKYGLGLFSKILSLRPMRFLGVISFSLYLWHLPMVKYLAGWDGVGVRTRIVIALSCMIAFSACSYLFIERPFLLIRSPEEFRKAFRIPGKQTERSE